MKSGDRLIKQIRTGKALYRLMPEAVIPYFHSDTGHDTLDTFGDMLLEYENERYDRALMWTGTRTHNN